MNWNKAWVYWYGFATTVWGLVAIGDLVLPMPSPQHFLWFFEVPNYVATIFSILFTAYFGFQFIQAIRKLQDAQRTVGKKKEF